MHLQEINFIDFLVHLVAACILAIVPTIGALLLSVRF